MIPVVWACRRDDVAARGYWDQTMITDLFDRVLWRPALGYEFTHLIGFDRVTPGEGAVVVVPARMEPDADWLNVQMADLPWCVVVLSSDEEARFPWTDLDHPNMRIWVQTPHPGVHQGADGFLPVGYTPPTRDVTALEDDADRKLDWVFAGQVTHRRRQELHRVLLDIGSDGLLLATDEFAGGMPQEAFISTLCDAKVAPCPAGPVNPDTFRLWEALQAGCVPVLDPVAGEKEGLERYWDVLFAGDMPPFPIVDEWDEFPALLAGLVDGWPFQAAQTGAWWMRYQRDLAYRFDMAIEQAGGTRPKVSHLADLITVVVTTSPVEANPGLPHLVETLGSLNDVGLAGCEVIVECDGVRTEQDTMTSRYHDALDELVRRCRHDWPNVLPVVHDQHQHQARMMRHALDQVRTPLVLFVEHDCPLDPPINWWPLVDLITDGTANLVRFHHEAQVLDEHRHLMPAPGPETVNGIELWRCGQWSQRPHLASADYYRRILGDHFDPEERWMIEDRMHSVIEVALNEDRWGDHRLWMYHEPGPTGIRHSRHLDARGEQPKWVDK